MTRPSILCGVDFTSACEEALRVAVEETHRRDGILDLIHVWYPVDPVPVDMTGIGFPVYNMELPSELHDRLDNICVDLPAARVRRHLEVGPAADRIAAKAEQLGSQVLVVGAHSHGALMRWFVGSVVNDLLRMSPCPVLVCRTPHANAERGTDASEENAADGARA